MKVQLRLRRRLAPAFRQWRRFAADDALDVRAEILEY
jgi:hypothetical protein